jgi:phosphoribosyl 1,2-cyclic phosphodiesterase
MRLTFLGVRGSTAAPGIDFAHYGGHTSCVAIAGADDSAPTLTLDAGTGLRQLTALLDGAAFNGSILLSHLHWDHMQGLPFFQAGDRPDAKVTLVIPAQEARSGRDLLAQTLSPPAFPITPEGLRGEWRFPAVEPGPIDVPGYTVRATEVQHKGGRTLGYRIERDGAAVGYLPDHAPAAGVSSDTIETMRGVDVLIHDAQFIESERKIADLFGHATIRDAIEFAQSVAAETLVLFHHGPNRTDAALDMIKTELLGTSDRLDGLRIVIAREGQTLDIVG